MRIAVIGAGNIGGTLSQAWRRAGHEVAVGTTEQGSVAAALAGAEAVLIAVPGGAVEEVLAEHGQALAGLAVIDAANSVGGAGPLSHLEAFARHAPQALAVRAFNSLGFENFADPMVGGERADLYWCGPDAAAEVTTTLITDVGLRPVRVGDSDAAPVVDGVAALWFALALRGGHGRRVAFRTLGIGG